MERMIRGRLLKVHAGHVIIHNVPPYDHKVAINEKRRHQKRACGIWGPSMVATILKCEAYIGNWHYRKNKHSKEEWLAINVPPPYYRRNLVSSPKNGERNKALARASRKHQYLPTGHIRCGLCGSRMRGHPAYWTSKNARGYYYYYRCVANHGTIANNICKFPQFRLEQVNGAVWQWVTEFLTNPELLEQGLADYQAEQEVKNERLIEQIAIIDELRADHKALLNRILDLYLECDFPKEMLVEKKTRLEETDRLVHTTHLPFTLLQKTIHP